ncbi:NADP-dependent oxidoreductase [Thermobifida fusca]|jgi:NADPH-dependent curcumin reductase CurA|uniref:Oxidoreductase n=2 Tax=Thermobifida fusca TaxID=2021 RepID=A0A9P2TB05_THEFU|nr:MULTISPECIES: NADP-dependent oxidoreductase [Thermobifida]AAZ55909.1 putative oxidoreductase [Thermobifida fusca YX]EOR70956.1 oxidoreductase [Thermobifida fusca TM51]MBO2531222.1 NADP-dependent oxidoreductase [Thermobifida sp.]MDD6793374.1 NADP-dependent oxidoreductase [Thermobifida fusca]PPS93623.1 NADP-dependent oxidoreductase [Thermobifida fusca]
MPTTAREFHLIARPQGEPAVTDFALVTRTLPDPGPGELLVRNLVLSVDPYMRGKMSGVRTYTDPYELNAPMEGGAVGVVEASTDPAVPTGTLVVHNAGWRSHALLPASRVRPLPADSPVDPSVYLGALGMPGLTAYVGLRHKAGIREGDTVFVSGAAGAVGSMVGQLAALYGARRVIGSAGSPEKVAYLRDELGFDAAFDYRAAPVREQLADAAPDGIDVYFDNVGGDHLEAAIACANDFARFAICGAISGYNATSAPRAPRNLFQIVTKRLTLRGFIVSDEPHLAEEFQREVAPAVADGRIKVRETVVEGLERTPEAFISMLRGGNIGKMVVRVAE